MYVVLAFISDWEWSEKLLIESFKNEKIVDAIVYQAHPKLWDFFHFFKKQSLKIFNWTAFRAAMDEQTWVRYCWFIRVKYRAREAEVRY